LLLGQACMSIWLSSLLIATRTPVPALDGGFFLLELDGGEHTVDIEGVMCCTLMPKNELARRLDASDAVE
jgi:hypothetical protein